MLSGKTVSIDYIIERLHKDYGFEVVRSDILEYVWDVVGFIGTPDPLKDKLATIEIEDHRGVLPYDYYSKNGVREYTTGTMMYETSDLFWESDNENIVDETEVITDTDPSTGEEFYTVVFGEDTPELFRCKIQGNYIYTAFETGRLELSYKAFPIDEDTGMPTIPDNQEYVRAVTSYIAERIAFKMMLMDLLSERKYEIIRQDYLFNVGAATAACRRPDVTRMEVLVNRWKSPHPYYEHFDEGFRYLGSKRNI